MSREFGKALEERFPKFLAITAKWREEDLIPGLSDLDTRVICRDMIPAQWAEMDRFVGEEHLREARQHPRWARILEHTPGVCMTESEMLDPQLYHPDAKHWSFYCGDQDAWARLEAEVQSWPWSSRDEQYYLKRFAMFYGPYQRNIDPPINIESSLERRYLWHSRAMHYFVPALQAGLCLLTRANVKGKWESLRRWLARRPDASVLNETADMIQRHYDTARLDDDQAMYEYEARCASFLGEALEEIRPLVTEADLRACNSVETVRTAVARLQLDPMMLIFDGVRFSRIRRGRYYFYLNAPTGFDATRLIEYEVEWLRRLFTRGLIQSYVRTKVGRAEASLDEALDLLGNGVLDKQALRVVRKVNELAFQEPAGVNSRSILEQVMALYESYYLALERILAAARLEASIS